MTGPESAALWCSLPLAVAVILDALEVMASRRQLEDQGLYGYPVLVTGHRILLNGPLAAPLGRLFRYPAVMSLPAAQLAAGGVLLVLAIMRIPALAPVAGVAAMTILAVRVLLHLRTRFGLDGSDQMILVSAGSVAAALLLPDPQARVLAIYYLAGQSLLGYAAAGAAKAVSPQWRSGRAIPGIISIRTYGTPALGAFLNRHSSAGRILCWSVIAFECAAAPLILAGTPGAIAIIGGALAFHVAVTLAMGLNIFFWSFAAAYPALLYLALAVDRLWH